MAYRPRFTISPRLLTLVEKIAALRERIRVTAVDVSWIAELQKAWLRMQTFSGDSSQRLVLRPQQERLLQLLHDHGTLAPSEIWAMLNISRQGAMNLLRLLLDAGIVENIGSKKSGRHALRQKLPVNESNYTLRGRVVVAADSVPPLPFRLQTGVA